MLDLENAASWTEIAPLNEGRYSFGLVTVGEDIYAVGGTNGAFVLRSIEVRYYI